MAALHVVRGPGEGHIIPIDVDPYRIGRNPDNDLVLAIYATSREHARIVRVEGKHHIEDNNSRNGTFVNNQPITTPTALKHNNRIRICDWIAVFLDTDCYSGRLQKVVLSPQWRTPTVISLALATREQPPRYRYPETVRDAYDRPPDDSSFIDSLDPARLAVLSDALEEAGCTDEALLGHLRSPGLHVPQCKALDLILAGA
jgi:pSer/pThr/pTyr-binding forkhead associated (FHA) protein